MARSLRLEYEGAVYHVTARGNERHKIFFTKKDYEKFKEYLADAVRKFGFYVHGYALMPNHYHIIIETPEPTLSKIMHYLNGSYTTYLNIKRKRSGHLFQGRFNSVIVDKDSYLLELSRYVHLNPVRATLVDRPQDYAYSSYRAYTERCSDGLVTTTTVLEMFSEKPKEARKRYRAFVEVAATGAQESPLKKVYGGIILGQSVFVKDALSRIEQERLQKEDASHRKILAASNLTEDILSLIAEKSAVNIADSNLELSNDLRKKTLYLLKKQTAAANKEIGAILGMKAPAVAKAHQRMVKEIESNVQLREEIKELETALSRVRG